MVPGGRLIFTLVLQFIALSLANQNLVPIFISEIDTFLRTDHEKAQESSVFACVKRCVLASDCKSINYKKQGGGDNCFLNKKNRKEAGETAIEANQDFVYYNIDYHTQRSEEPEFGTSNINMPTVPPVMTVGACVSSPCQNGGTCVEHSTENGFHCNCTESFNGTRCELPVMEFSLWRNVTESELVISKSSNVTVNFTADEKGVVVEISQPYLFMCPDQDSYPVDGVLISVPGNWKRISFKQTFLETQECYAIFGSVPSWVSGIPFNDPGVEEFDPYQDELWLEQFLGDNGDEYSGDNALCGSNHFWMVNDAKGNIPIAGVSLRRKNDAVDAGISTYGKCGMFKFLISDIRVLD